MITSQSYYELRVDLEDWEGDTRYAKYRMFKVEYSNQSYTLIVEGYSGTAGIIHTHVDTNIERESFIAINFDHSLRWGIT